MPKYRLTIHPGVGPGAQDTQTYNPFPVKATVWRIVIDWTTHSDQAQCSDHKIAGGKLQSLSYEAPGRHHMKP